MLRLAKGLMLTSVIVTGLTGAAFAATCEVTGGKIQAAMTTNPSTMDPILTTTNASRQIDTHLFESLVTLDENYKIIPQLATSWTKSDDGLTYTFTLRDGVKFHNGATMTADDVVASVQRFLQFSPGANRFKKIASVEAVDPKTVKITVSEDFPLLTNLSMPSPIIAIMPADIVKKYGKDEIRGADVIGTGPYKLVDWQPDVGVKMQKFADYVPEAGFDGPTGFGGARTACADEVDFLPVTEESSRVAGLETGDFDFVEALPITSVPDLQNNPDVKVAIVKPTWGIALEIDHKDPWMAKLPFRQALLAAINPEQVLMAATFGQKDYYRVSPSIFFPEQTNWYSEAGAEAYNHPDMDKVKKLLADAGYNGEPITYLTNQNYGWMYKASQALAAQWQAAGINVQLSLMDWPSQIQRAQHQTDWALNQTGWSPRFDPFQLTDSLGCGSLGAFGYCNDKMQAQLDIINSGATDDRRKAAWQAIQKLVWDDVAVLRIGDYFQPDGIRKTLAGYTPFYVTPRFWNVSQTRK